MNFNQNYMILCGVISVHWNCTCISCSHHHEDGYMSGQNMLVLLYNKNYIHTPSAFVGPFKKFYTSD